MGAKAKASNGVQAWVRLAWCAFEQLRKLLWSKREIELKTQNMLGMHTLHTPKSLLDLGTEGRGRTVTRLSRPEMPSTSHGRNMNYNTRNLTEIKGERKQRAFDICHIGCGKKKVDDFSVVEAQ